MGAYLSWSTEGDTGPVQILYFDATKNEDYKEESTPSDHPVQSGSDITDNLRQMPNRVDLTVFVSSVPIKGRTSGSVQAITLPRTTYNPPFRFTPGSIYQTALNAIKPGNNKDVVAKVWKYSTKIYPVAETLETLRTLKNFAQKVTVVSSQFDYDNMYITSFNPTKSPADGTGITINISLQELRVVDTKKVQLILANGDGKKTSPTTNKGEQPTVPVERTSSLYKDLNQGGPEGYAYIQKSLQGLFP